MTRSLYVAVGAGGGALVGKAIAVLLGELPSTVFAWLFVGLGVVAGVAVAVTLGVFQTLLDGDRTDDR